jgi:hypothetical protein
LLATEQRASAPPFGCQQAILAANDQQSAPHRQKLEATAARGLQSIHNDCRQGNPLVPTRRTILKSAAALSAAPLAPKIVFADGRDPAVLDALVIDARHAEARAFGRRASEWGAPLRTIDGDITDLWIDELNARWQSNPAAVAGLTERPALFVIERLAWDRGLRVVFEAEHLPVAGDADAGAVHKVVRSANARLESELGAAGQGWPRVLADQLLTGARVATRDYRPSGAAMAASIDEPTKLYSWIIAPRTAA